MSNRLLWILILLWFIWFWYIYYHLNYLPNRDQEAKLFLANELKIKQAEEKEKNKIKLLRINTNNIISNKDKIRNLIESEKYYKLINLNNWWKIYCTKNDSKIEIFYNDIKVGIFDLVLENEINIQEIFWDENDLYIKLRNNNYFFDISKKKLSTIDIKVVINYIKKWNANNLILVTNKWSTIYNLVNKKIKYFSYFNDYVFFEKWYIWLVKPIDLNILNNLWYKAEWNNLIVYYNPFSKVKKILFKIEWNVNKIYTKNNSVYLESNNWEIYELNNIKKNID